MLRAVSDISCSEDAGDTRLQQQGVASERPALGALPVLHQVQAGKDVAALGSRYQVADEFTLRLLADKHKQSTGRRCPPLFVRTRLDHYLLDPLIIAMNFDELRLEL